MKLFDTINPYYGGFRLLTTLVLLLALAFPIATLAKKPSCPGHPSCGDGGGEDPETTLSPTNTTASWSGNISAVARNCVTESYHAGQGTVQMACSRNDDYPETVLQTSVFTASGRKPELCDMLSDGLILGDEDSQTNGLFYSSTTEWNGELCLNDNTGNVDCRIRAFQTSYGFKCHSSELNNAGDCPRERLILVEGFGLANAAPAPELNPFTQSQSIALNELTITFKALGKNRTEATCAVGTGGSTGVTFHSIPVE